jgi:hypothetical protein
MNIDYKKLTEQKEELKTAWQFLRLPEPYPENEIPLWLLDYGKEMIQSGFKTLKKKIGKVADPVAYLATILRNAKKQNMTPEQREAEISHMRSAVAKLGAAKRHEKEISYLKKEFAEVCKTLPDDAEL